MIEKKKDVIKQIAAIKVHQWLKLWDKVKYDAKIMQARPPDHFYLCTIKAGHLKALTGVYQRSIKGGKARIKDPNVQRGHEEERSKKIREFVQYGWPCCDMNESKRRLPQTNDLLKPGWLPTAIIINILPPGEERNGIKIPESDLVDIEDKGSSVLLNLPNSFSGANWEPAKVYPFEVIDGQHRLWAFDDFDPSDDFELPVVAFYGLDRGWQAYLFWSINITPKKINRSLAFDLYPLLRQQTWLDKFAGHSIYRETRCQELVEIMWSHSESPWYQKINMLGETKSQRDYQGPMVSQAAWIRSLMASFVKQWDDTSSRIGGLFGAPPSADSTILPWTRPMQAAFLICAGNALKKSIKNAQSGWAKYLRSINNPTLFDTDDSAFYGDYSLISTDQGIRGFLFIVNDLCFVKAKELKLESWRWEDVSSELPKKTTAITDDIVISAAIKSFNKTACEKFIHDIADALSKCDWRTSSTPIGSGFGDKERMSQAVFRGSSGYKEMRMQLLKNLSNRQDRVGQAAKDVMKILGY